MFIFSGAITVATFLLLLFNFRNKFAYVITLKMMCISVMMIVGTLYITKSATYVNMGDLDYDIYSRLVRLRMDFIRLSQIYNICFAAYMLISVMQIKITNKLRIRYIVVMLFAVILYVLCNTFEFQYKIYILSCIGNEQSAFYKVIFEGLGNFSMLLLNMCMLLPYAVTAKAIYDTKIFTLKKSYIIFTICILLVDIFMNYVFIYGKFRPVFSTQVSLFKLPAAVNIDLNSYIKLPIIYFVIFGIVNLLIMVFKPFEINSGLHMSRWLSIDNIYSNNMAVKEHVYKNAFIAVGQQLTLADKNLEKKDLDAVRVNMDIMREIVGDYVSTIERNLKRCSVSRFKMKKTDITECISAAAAKTIPRNEVNVIKAYENKQVFVYGDGELLTEVMVNLLMNALEAMKRIERKPEIIIDLITESELLMITVQDNGRGIAPENINKVFQPFYSTKPKNMCGGIGLNYVKKVIQRHGGEIRAVSRLDEFTRFEIVLPYLPNGGDSNEKN